MLERWVASVFSSYLGRYIKNLDRHGLQVSMWSGEVVLHDLELVPEALDEFDLPVIIEKGVIGQLRIEIPWKHFYSKTCKVEVSDVQLVVLPIKGTQWNEVHERQKRKLRKQAQLRIFESTRTTQQQVATDESEMPPEESEGFGSRISKHIISSLKVTISNVVLRYEDACTDSRRPVVWTIKMKELSAVPTDSDWRPDEGATRGNRTFRLCKLEGLTLSIDHLPVAPRLTGPSKITSPVKWKEIMTASSEITSQSCTPEPLEVELHVTTQVSHAALDLSHPKNTVDASFKCLNIRLKRWQYDAMNRTARYIADFAMLDKFRQFKPATAVKGNAKSWWLFAYKCIRLVRAEKRTRTHVSWEKLKKRRELKEKYIQLYKRSQGVPWRKALSADEEQALADLEEQLDAESLIYFRRLAYFQLRMEKEQHKDMQMPDAKKEGGWWQWWSGWSGEVHSETREEEEVWKLIDADEWTPEQRKMLYEELGIEDPESEEPNEQQPTSIPSTYVQTMVQVTIWKGIVEMCESSQPPKTARELLECMNLPTQDVPENLTAADLLMYDAPSLAQLGIDESVIAKYKTVFGLHAAMAVTPRITFASIQLMEFTSRWNDMHKSWKIVNTLKDIEMTSASLSGSHYTSLIRKGASSSAHLLLATVSRELDDNCAGTYTIDAHLRPMDAIVDVPWLQTVCAFWGVGVYGKISDLETAKKQETVVAVVADLETALRMSLERETNVNVSVIMDQPCLIVPSDCRHPDSTALMLTADAFSIYSDTDPVAGRERRKEYLANDYYNHYVIKSDYGRVMTTTIRKWSSMSYRDYDSVCRPLVVDAVLDLRLLASLVPKCPQIPKTTVKGELRNIVVHMSRSNMLTAEQAFTNLLELAWNITGRGSVDVTRAEAEDETGDTCSTFALVLGPMPEEVMDMNASPQKQYCELDGTSGHLRLHDKHKSSKVATLVDLSSGHFEINEVHNAITITINREVSLWIQLPTASMHNRWLQSFRRIKAGNLIPVAHTAVVPESKETCQQTWFALSIELGDFKIQLEEDNKEDSLQSGWVLPNSRICMNVTGHDSKFELQGSSLVVTDGKGMQQLWSNEGEPGFSVWWLSFMPSSKYFDPLQTQQALMQMGVNAKGIGLQATTETVEAMEMLWDLVNISLQAKENTKVYTAKNIMTETVDHPPELPKIFEQKQGIGFFVEVEGEVELWCHRADGELVMRTGGEDFVLQFFDGPYGINVDGMLQRPWLENALSDGKWTRFVEAAPDSRLDFEYVNFQNRGALKGDMKPPRPTYYSGYAFTHQLRMSLAHGEITYFQSFLWTILEYFKTGLCTRLAYISWRPVYNGQPMVIPYEEYDPMAVPTEPYFDLLKVIVECSDITMLLPPTMFSDRGVFRGHAENMGVCNELIKTEEGDTVFVTRILVDGMTMEVPDEMADEVPGGRLFAEPITLTLDTTHSMIDPCQRHPKTLLHLSIPNACVMYYSDNVYCSLLAWMTKSLMEPWKPHYPTPPPPPLAYTQTVDSPRYNHFTWQFSFNNLLIVWLERAIPIYSLGGDMRMAVRWYTNDDFENDIILNAFSVCEGVNSDIVMQLEEGGVMKTEIKWITPDEGRRVQELVYTIDKKFLVVLDHRVLVHVVDSLMSSRACRAGAFKLMGWVEPEGGWPAPGEPWPEGPPAEQIIRHIVNFSNVEVQVPNVCTLSTSPSLTYEWRPGGARSFDFSLSTISMQDARDSDVITAQQDEKAVSFSISKQSDEASWEKATGRVGELTIVATVMCFSSLYTWAVSSEFKLLANIWAATPERRLEAIKAQPVQATEGTEGASSKLALPVFDLAWNRPKVAILCSNNSHRGFVVDFGMLHLKTSKNEQQETVTASLVDLAIKSVFRDDYVLRPTKVQIQLKRTDIDDTERRVITVEGDAIESFFDFSDVRTIAAVAYDYSASLSGVKKSRLESATVPAEQSPQQLMARARAPTTEGIADSEVLHVEVTLPLLSLSISSGNGVRDDLNLPALEEPNVKGTISISQMVGNYSQRTTGHTDLKASFERFGIDADQGPVLQFEGTTFSYKQGDGDHGDQNMDIDLGNLSLVIMPQFFFGVMNFVYLPYAAATMPDTFAAPDVIIIDSDFELSSDMVLNRDKKLLISGKKQNLITLDGKRKELHLIGDKPLIQIESGVTLMIVSTKLYLYNKELHDFVDRDDGACIYVVPNKNEIDRGVPPITAWSAKKEGNAHPVSVRITTKFSLSVVLPELQEKLDNGIEMRFSGEGSYVWTTVGEAVVGEEALFSVKDFTVRPVLSESMHLLEPVEVVNISLKENNYKVQATSFHLRLSSADAGLITRAIKSLQTSLGIISKQAQLKIEKDDADIIREAIVRSQTERKEIEVVPKTGDIFLPTIDILVVEDSSGFDIPLFFAQLLCVEAKGGTAADLQKFELVNATLNLDYYNLETCEWESVLTKPITTSGRYYTVGQHKKDISITITPINTLITPQLVKTLTDAKRFGAAFSPQPAARQVAASIFQATESSSPMKSQKPSAQFRMYEVVNQTGYALEINLQGEDMKLTNLDSVHFNFGKKYGKEVRHCIELCIEGQQEMTEVDVGKVGTAGVDLRLNERKIKLFCSVQLTDTGRKKVTIKSSVAVVNKTPHQLQITAARAMISNPGESVSIPHAALQDSYIKVMPLMPNGYAYSQCQLGLPFGLLHKLHRELFVLTSHATMVPEDTEPPPDFTCFVDIYTDVDGVGDTTITLLPVFEFQNLTGLPVKFKLYSCDGSGDQKRTLTKLFKRTKKASQFVLSATGNLPTDETASFCEANPFHALYMDLEIMQPTGEVVRRQESRYPTPFLVRNSKKNHQGRVSTIILSDNKGRNLHLTVEYSERMVTVFCPLWIINQTTFCLELAVHNPMKLAESAHNALTAGQTPGEGIKPGSKPFLMAPDLAEKDQVGHLYVRILRAGKGIPQWSAKIDVSKVGGVGTIECPEKSGELPKTIAFNIEFPWGRVATRTRVIRLTPRWIINNRTLGMIEFRHEVRGAGVTGQKRPRSVFEVPPQNTHQEYEGGASDNFMAIKSTKSKNSRYCKPFPIDRMGDNDVNLMYIPDESNGSHEPIFGNHGDSEKEADLHEFDVVRVAIFKRGPIIYITIDPLVKPPIVVENRTPYPVWANQAEGERRKDPKHKQQLPLRFPPKSTRPFTWVYQEGEKVMDIKVAKEGKWLNINLDPRNENREAGEDDTTMRECKAPETDETVYIRVRHRHGTTKISLTLDNEIDKWFESPPLAISGKLNIQGMGIVLLSNDTEIAHLSLQSIVLYRKRDKTTINYSVKVGAIQLDDQKVKAEFPVVICNKIPKDRSPFFVADALRKIDRSSAAVHIQTSSAKFQPLIVKLHDKFLYSLLNFYRTSQEKVELSNKLEGKKYYTVPTLDASAQVPDKQDGFSTRHLYIEHLQIDAISLQSTLVRSPQEKDQDFFKHMLGFLAVLVRGFEDMTLVWPKIEIYKLCNKAWLIGTMLKDKYYSETTSQFLRVAPGVATVHTFVTDLLSTMPRDQDQMEYQTPSKRVRDPARQGAIVIGTKHAQQSPTSSPRMIPTLQTFSSVGSPAHVGSSLGSPEMRDEDSADGTTQPTADNVTAICVRASTYFGVGQDLSEELFCEGNTKLMTKQRAVDLRSLKKKSWEKFHPSGGRTSWAEFSQTCTWEEFQAHTTETEFKTHANYALDQYIRSTLAVGQAKKEHCRCSMVQEMKAKGELLPPSAEQSRAVQMTWYEFAHHTSWDEFKSKTTAAEFRRYAHYARDCCLGDTVEFIKLDKEQAITMFNM
eukprot:TRINITY_DN11275_c0_g1_i1.p1 TRINITY_DN11275_c0_g1~~TRINITY_DN11275_c0_g1_i1.p1  ORF type:complete len:3800 (+),score=1280.83 TRINITY_DN11275_c0_g1_i1:59-11401(+)